METRKRSLVKALIWSGLGLVTMGIVGAIATGSFWVGGAVALTNTGIGLVMYLLYERIWAAIRWGRHV
jgi:uncharacterized membrane protein